MARQSRHTRILIWMLCFALYLPTNGQDPTQEVQWFSEPPCNTDADCDIIHFDALCLPYTEQSGDTTVTVTRCTCNNDNKFYKVNEDCIFYADVGDTCDNNTSVCSDVNAICAHDGGGYGVTRCICREGTRLVKSQGQIVCAYELTIGQDSVCEDCVMNHGVCYDLDNSGSKDGCYCPATLSGDDCEVSHVNVTCNIDSMHICYLPHPDVDLSTGAWIHVNNLGHKVGCVAVLREDICGPGQFYLELPLQEALRDMCMTKKLEYSGRVKYSNELVVQHHHLFSSPEDIYFGVFCSFKSYHDLNVLGIPVNSITETEVGQDISPFLTLSVKTQIGQTVNEDTAFRVGDKVYFHLYLDTEEGYSALRVEFCTLSSSPIIPDTSASTLPIITHGCPASGQSFINEQNMWYRVQGQLNELETGLVQIIKLQQGSSLNLHCTIKLCILGSEAACEPAVCSASQERKRRSVETGKDSKFVKVHGQLKIEDDNHHTQLDSMEVAAIIFSVLLLLTILIIAISIAIRAKPRGRQKNRDPPRDPLETVSSNYIAGLRLDDPPSSESNV